MKRNLTGNDTEEEQFEMLSGGLNKSQRGH